MARDRWVALDDREERRLRKHAFFVKRELRKPEELEYGVRGTEKAPRKSVRADTDGLLVHQLVSLAFIQKKGRQHSRRLPDALFVHQLV